MEPVKNEYVRSPGEELLYVLLDLLCSVGTEPGRLSGLSGRAVSVLKLFFSRTSVTCSSMTSLRDLPVCSIKSAIVL